MDQRPSPGVGGGAAAVPAKGRQGLPVEPGVPVEPEVPGKAVLRVLHGATLSSTGPREGREMNRFPALVRAYVFVLAAHNLATVDAPIDPTTLPDAACSGARHAAQRLPC